MRDGGCLSILTLTALMLSVRIVHAEATDPIAPYRSAREAFQTNFRVSGVHDPAVLTQNLPALRSLAAANNGELRARALLEITYIQRVSNAFAQAASTYTEAANIAEPLGRMLLDGFNGHRGGFSPATHSARPVGDDQNQAGTQTDYIATVSILEFASSRLKYRVHQIRTASLASDHLVGIALSPALKATMPPTIAAFVSQSPPTRMTCASAFTKSSA
jgi:hypothetical protein